MSDRALTGGRRGGEVRAGRGWEGQARPGQGAVNWATAICFTGCQSPSGEHSQDSSAKLKKAHRTMPAQHHRA